MPEEAIDDAADGHQPGKEAGAGQVAGHFRDPQALLDEKRGPLRHGELGGAGAEHQQDGGHQGRFADQVAQWGAMLVRDDCGHGRFQQEEDIRQRDGRPEDREQGPAVMPDPRQQQGCADDDGDLSPAVEGVQEAHGGRLAVGGRGKRIDDGADEDFKQAAADGVDDDGE